MSELSESAWIPFVQLKHRFHIWYRRCFDTGESGNGDNIGWSHIPLALYPTNRKVCAGQGYSNPKIYWMLQMIKDYWQHFRAKFLGTKHIAKKIRTKVSGTTIFWGKIIWAKIWVQHFLCINMIHNCHSMAIISSFLFLLILRQGDKCNYLQYYRDEDFDETDVAIIFDGLYCTWC